MEKLIQKSFRFVSLLLFAIYIFCLPFVNNGYTKDLEGWESAPSAKYSYLMKKFSIPVGKLKSIKIGKSFSENTEVYEFSKIHRLYALSLSAEIMFHNKNSLVRVILVGTDLHEYLVFEAYPLIVDNVDFSIRDVCEETCLLDGISPYILKVQLIETSITIDKLSYVDASRKLKMKASFLRKKIKKEQNAAKIRKINDDIKEKKLKWVAGETSISQLSYEEKKNLFMGNEVPNLQGAEYYKGGIFEIKSGDQSPSLNSNDNSSLIESFDWRNRHGANDPVSPYYDGDPDGSGWITSVKRQCCADCWAHSAVGATEAVSNLFFNQHIDLDLSEQDLVSCANAGSCRYGGNTGAALRYIRDNGIVDESCFPESGVDEPCSNICSSPYELIEISGYHWINPSEGDGFIKAQLLEYGPLAFGISSWWHCMVLVGYQVDPYDGRPIWILKNSWGTSWGEDGYGRIKVDNTDIYLTYAIENPVISKQQHYEILCLDIDGDGFYNWGISSDKPFSCPDNSYSEKDCDDSNPNLGPFASDGSCIEMVIVDIDIKPGSYPNSINLKSKGKVPVAILTTDVFDAHDVDPVSCVFAGAYPLRWNMEDVEHDGDQDILFHFMIQELNLNQNSTKASLEGLTYDGLKITGTDSINIVPKSKANSKKIK